ncbi:hypothetical protein G7046_g4569 [Stylonectria norvegica]|nr:hypothetical protein G7046_g4569 [Stylonectria norvegica]
MLLDFKKFSAGYTVRNIAKDTTGEWKMSTLAFCFVYQHGFNAAEAHGTGSDNDQDLSSLRAGRNLNALSPILSDNLEATTNEALRRMAFAQHTSDMEKEASAIMEDIERVTAKVDKMQVPQEWPWERPEAWSGCFATPVESGGRKHGDGHQTPSCSR